MKEALSRRQLITGMALGGVALATGCDSDDGNTPAGPLPADFPYQQFIPASFQLDAAKVKEDAYQLFWAGACCHGVYKSVMQQLADRLGAPFTLLPMDMAIFGGGGIAGYGSICGALLGGVLAINSVVAVPADRTAMMTDLMRWYEGTAFPAYVPTAVNAAETGTTLDFSAGNIVNLQIVPQNHLCHASRTQWSARNNVAANGMDLSARCGRLTADVAGKVVEQLNAYFATNTFTAAAIDSGSATCLTCHPASSTSHPVATGMRCDACHSDKTSGHP